MSKVTISLTKDQLDFIRFIAGKVEKSSELSKKMDKCMEPIIVSEDNSNTSKETLADIRKKHNPGITAEFLSLFGAPSGLKFLTHDFDPDSNMTMATVIKQVRSIISSQKYICKLPSSLYALIINFLSGEKWYDYNNVSHSTNLSSGGLRNWIDSNSTLHPISSPQYGNEIQDFRKTVRISKPILPELISSFISNTSGLQNLQIKTENLDKADFYTNVNRLINFIIGKVMKDIAQRNPTAEVIISYQRSSWNEFRLCKILITHIDSEANPFDEVQKKIFPGGGALYELAKNCQGYCDWTIEANFEGEYKRWRILSAQDLPEIETIDKNEIKGFTHILTIYKY